MTTALVKSEVRPSASVSRPSPSTCSSRSKTAGCGLFDLVEQEDAVGLAADGGGEQAVGPGERAGQARGGAVVDVLVHVEAEQAGLVAVEVLAPALWRRRSCPRRSGRGTGTCRAAGRGRSAGPWRWRRRRPSPSSAASWPMICLASALTTLSGASCAVGSRNAIDRPRPGGELGQRQPARSDVAPRVLQRELRQERRRLPRHRLVAEVSLLQVHHRRQRRRGRSGSGGGLPGARTTCIRMRRVCGSLGSRTGRTWNRSAKPRSFSRSTRTASGVISASSRKSRRSTQGRITAATFRSESADCPAWYRPSTSSK